MKENRTDKLLRLWKARQIAEGYDVSNVNTLEEAEHYFDKKFGKKKVVEGTITVVEASKSYKELQAEAKELGLKTVGVSKEDLIKAIAEVKEIKPVEEQTKEDITIADPIEGTVEDIEMPEIPAVVDNAPIVTEPIEEIKPEENKGE